MERNKGMYGIIAVALCLLLVGCAESPTGAATHDEPITIGFMSALTGDAAAWGEPILRGATLAVEEINADGGIDGRRLALAIEDTGCDAATGVSAAHRLIAQRELDVITGIACSSVMLGIAPLAETERVLLLGTAPTNPAITHAGDYIFRLWASDAYEGRETAADAFGNGARRMALIVLNNDYADGLADAFAAEFTALGGEILLREGYYTGSRDFRTAILKALRDAPDAIYIAANPGETPALLQQIRQISDIPLYVNGPAILADGVIDAAGEAAEGIRSVRPASKDAERFIAAYVARYGEEPPLTASAGYDSIRVLALSMEECPPAATACIRDRLYALRGYAGASGPITLDENGDRVDVPFERLVIEDGSPVVR